VKLMCERHCGLAARSLAKETRGTSAPRGGGKDRVSTPRNSAPERTDGGGTPIAALQLESPPFPVSTDNGDEKGSVVAERKGSDKK